MRIARLSAILLATTCPAFAQQVLTSNLTTPAATAEQARLCAPGAAFPPGWTWNASAVQAEAASATSGKPRIDQVRAGKVIATYTSFDSQPTCNYLSNGQDNVTPAHAASSGCGAFGRAHALTLDQFGDVFQVYPAQYLPPYNGIYLGAKCDGNPTDVWPACMHTVPNITIKGMVQGGVRPVLAWNAGAPDATLGQSIIYNDVGSDNLTISNLDVIGGPNVSVGNAGVFLAGGASPTLEHMRISGFAPTPAMTGGANGLITSGNLTGTLTLRALQLDHNGGENGPRHNAYIAASLTDPGFGVVITHSYLHDVFYGHLFKSRAQHTTATANYFQGGTPQPPNTQAETYLLDMPNGGTDRVVGNVFVKNASGPNSNAFSVTYGMEMASYPGTTAPSLDIENNTFLALAATFDGQHPLSPVSMFYPQVAPGQPGFPAATKVTEANNVFAGYCPTGTPALDWRGTTNLTAAISELNTSYQLATKYSGAATAIVGSPTYAHVARSGPARTLPTVGAMD